MERLLVGVAFAVYYSHKLVIPLLPDLTFYFLNQQQHLVCRVLVNYCCRLLYSLAGCKDALIQHWLNYHLEYRCIKYFFFSHSNNNFIWCLHDLINEFYSLLNDFGN